MAKTNTKSEKKKLRPAMSPDAREKQLIALAMDRAEEQLLDGTASSQVITHFLKLGSERERMERERLEEENKLLRAKTKAIEDTADKNDLYEKAIKVFRGYAGFDEGDEGYDDY